MVSFVVVAYLVAVVGLFSLPFIWLLVIRPYARKYQKGYTPGATAGLTCFIDWQEASEIAKERGDRVIIRVCQFWIGCQLLSLIMFVGIPLISLL